MKAYIDERLEISIHALREEGDLRHPCNVGSVHISIHALREEGDGLSEKRIRVDI